MTIKPLPGQPSLFEAAPTTADEAQAAAAARRGDEEKSVEVATCSWGDCQRPAKLVHPRSGEHLCRLHIMWAFR